MILLLLIVFIQRSIFSQISGSKLWLQERSCMCCQESGEREAVVQLFCPKAKSGDPKIRRVRTYVLQSMDE